MKLLDVPKRVTLVSVGVEASRSALGMLYRETWRVPLPLESKPMVAMATLVAFRPSVSKSPNSPLLMVSLAAFQPWVGSDELERAIRIALLVLGVTVISVANQRWLWGS